MEELMISWKMNRSVLGRCSEKRQDKGSLYGLALKRGLPRSQRDGLEPMGDASLLEILPGYHH